MGQGRPYHPHTHAPSLPDSLLTDSLSLPPSLIAPTTPRHTTSHPTAPKAVARGEVSAGKQAELRAIAERQRLAAQERAKGDSAAQELGEALYGG